MIEIALLLRDWSSIVSFSMTKQKETSAASMGLREDRCDTKVGKECELL